MRRTATTSTLLHLEEGGSFGGATSKKQEIPARTSCFVQEMLNHKYDKAAQKSFLKKGQKLWSLPGLRGSTHLLRTRVFWFFFAKKNCFLPLPQCSNRGMLLAPERATSSSAEMKLRGTSPTGSRSAPGGTAQ